MCCNVKQLPVRPHANLEHLADYIQRFDLDEIIDSLDDIEFQYSMAIMNHSDELTLGDGVEALNLFHLRMIRKALQGKPVIENP